MKRVFAVILVAGAVAVAAITTQTRAASAKGAANIAQLNIGLQGSVSNLDPARALGGTNNYLWFIYDGLVRYAPNGKLVPWLATKVQHPNANTWIYFIRHGVKFWDGNELTATDVANSLNYYRYPKFATAFLFRSVRNVTAIGKYTVKVDLKHPDATFPYTPAFMSFIFEKSYADAHPGQWGKPGTLPMASGPFRIVSLDPTRGAEFVANDKYWGGKPKIRHISIKFFADETSLAVAMRSGAIDLAFPEDARSFGATAGSGVSITQEPSCSIGLLSMNTQVAPWNDVHVRRAVAYATDRAGIAKALGGNVSPEQWLIPKQMWSSTGVPASAVNKLYAGLPQYPFSLAKAKAELAKSHYPNGFSASTPVTAALPQPTTAAQVLAADLQKIGIKLTLNNVTVGQWVGFFFGPRANIGLFPTGSGCATPDPSWYSGTFLDSANAKTGSTNIADYVNPAVDTLLKAGLVTTAPAKRLAAYGAILKAAQTDVPYVTYYTVVWNLALSNKFKWPTANPHSVGNGAPWPLEILSK
jgi:peptide/nickel transport system substrate-binding protein